MTGNLNIHLPAETGLETPRIDQHAVGIPLFRTGFNVQHDAPIAKALVVVGNNFAGILVIDHVAAAAEGPFLPDLRQLAGRVIVSEPADDAVGGVVRHQNLSLGTIQRGVGNAASGNT